MASPAYEQILAIQELDLQRRQVKHRLATHPLRTQLAERTDAAAAARAALTAVEARRHELEREQKRLADEVATIESKRSELDAKLYGGEVTASKELLALQEEGANLLERQRAIEDDEIELMEQAEVLDEDVSSQQAAVSSAEDAESTAGVELESATAELGRELDDLDGRRAEAAAPANPELLSRYETLAVDYDGIAVARLVNGACDGCHIRLSAVAIDQMKKAPEDAVITCEECGRLLVR
ncbi:MAG: C4-type zinc ribbon domain-containing protein [Actinomycetota bacterium]